MYPLPSRSPFVLELGHADGQLLSPPTSCPDLGPAKPNRKDEQSKNKNPEKTKIEKATVFKCHLFSTTWPSRKKKKKVLA